jgi:membrane fusion protein, multidrug efflux system
LGAKQETAAALQVAEAQVKLAQLNHEYTSIASPLSGRVGDRLLSEGNFISGGTSNSPPLATVVAVDPIVVTFEIDESTLQNVQRAANDGRLAVGKVGEIPVSAGLAIDDDQYPLQGLVNFFDNRIDENTGTLRAKAEFSNPIREAGGRLVSPGMFVRIRLALGKPHAATLVPESALGSDQGTRYLFIVDEKNQADRLNVSIGGTFGSMVEIAGVTGMKETQERPLAPDEKIIIRGLQRVRPGMIVDPQRAP